MRGWLAVLLLLLATWCPAGVCLEDIQRSAKNYWEYRAVKPDGTLVVYDCRAQAMVQPQQMSDLDAAGVALFRADGATI
ncbi:MAG: hypothetical protein HC926_03180 [Synechococcaceae cyanobacterium SM2_3_60]|nr:hypothetical protein [Synechococcaceae cyanobacterium SM2_3_60]